MSKTSGTSGTAWHCLAAMLFSSGTRCGFVSRTSQRKALHCLPYRVYRKIYERSQRRKGCKNKGIFALIFHVENQAGERLWVGNRPRADSHRTAEPTVWGFAGFRDMPKSVGQNEDAWVDFGVNNPLKPPHNESLMESQNGVNPERRKIWQEWLN